MMLHLLTGLPARPTQHDARTHTVARAQSHFPPCRFSALRRLVTTAPARYAQTRNQLDGAVTALSPYLTHGIIQEVELARAWRCRFDLSLDDKLLQELAWRCFFQDVWLRHGNRILTAMRPSTIPSIRYRPSLPDDILHACTGVPVIDASIRRLYRDGYLHNHQRMWLASYCIHLRKVDWRTAADWMYGYLLDGDLASNHLSWQWVGSTFSSKPYLFNADNVARFAPELRSPGTRLDCDYPTLAAIACSDQDVGAESGQHAMTAAPRLMSRPGRAQPAVDFEKLVRNQDVTLLHPWNLSGRTATSKCVIGVIHTPFHSRFPWSEKRWDFVMTRMQKLCDAVWIGDIAQFRPILQCARSTHVESTANPDYTAAFKSLPVKQTERARWLPSAPAGTDSFSAYLRFMRRTAPDWFRQSPLPLRKRA